MSETQFNERLSAMANVLGVDETQLGTTFAEKLGVTKDNANEFMGNQTDFPISDMFKHLHDEGPKVGAVLIRKAYRIFHHGLNGGTKLETEEDLQQKLGISEDTFRLLIAGQGSLVDFVDISTLISVYNPNKKDIVHKLLKKRFKSVPVIVFNEDGTVAVDETVAYITDLENNLPPVNIVYVDNIPVKPMVVGISPTMEHDEDPMFRNHVLRNGRSTVNHLNWDVIHHDERLLCRYAVLSHDVKPTDKSDAGYLYRLLRERPRDFSVEYPKAYMLYKEHEKKNMLPTLKIAAEDLKRSDFPHGKKDNPFKK